PVGKRKFLGRPGEELESLDEPVDLHTAPGARDPRIGNINAANFGPSVYQQNRILAVATTEFQDILASHIAEQVVRVFDREGGVSRRRQIAFKYSGGDSQVAALGERSSTAVTLYLAPIPPSDSLFINPHRLYCSMTQRIGGPKRVAHLSGIDSNIHNQGGGTRRSISPCFSVKRGESHVKTGREAPARGYGYAGNFGAIVYSQPLRFFDKDV